MSNRRKLGNQRDCLLISMRVMLLCDWSQSQISTKSWGCRSLPVARGWIRQARSELQDFLDRAQVWPLCGLGSCSVQTKLKQWKYSKKALKDGAILEFQVDGIWFSKFKTWVRRGDGTWNRDLCVPVGWEEGCSGRATDLSFRSRPPLDTPSSFPKQCGPRPRSCFEVPCRALAAAESARAVSQDVEMGVWKATDWTG